MTPKQLRISLIRSAFSGSLTNGTERESDACLEQIDKWATKYVKKIRHLNFGEVPVDSPMNWKWVSFSKIVTLEKGKTVSGEALPYLEARYLRGKASKTILKSGELVKPGTKVLLVDGENSGEVFSISERGYLGSTFKILNINPNVEEAFVIWFLKLHQEDYRNNKKGAAIPHLNKDIFYSMPFPVPPRDEQIAIANKIHDLMPFVDKYEYAWNQLEILNKSIPGSLEKSVLQAAFMGKIAPQIDAEGTGAQTYQQIKKDRLNTCSRIRDRKIPSEINDDEIPFEIPPTWKWCRLNDIVYNRGQQTPTSKFSYIDIGSIDNRNKKLNDTENIIEADRAPSRARKIVCYGDVLYSTVRPYLHNICIVDRVFSCLPIASTGFAVLTPYSGLFNKYLFYYLCSPGFDAYANASDNSKGAVYPAINDDRLYRALIPLPPLEEQKRIVAKIEELLPLINKIEGTKKSG